MGGTTLYMECTTCGHGDTVGDGSVAAGEGEGEGEACLEYTEAKSSGWGAGRLDQARLALFFVL